MFLGVGLVWWGVLGGTLLVVVLLGVLGKVPLKYNARNLAVRWQTTLLTGLAFTLVVGLMTWMLAFVAGMYRLTQGSAQPANQGVGGEGTGREMGPDRGKPSLQEGGIFDMADGHWAVVGVMQSAGSNFDSEIWAKHQIVGEKFGKKNFSTAVLRTAGAG